MNLSCPAGSSWAEWSGPDSPLRRSGAKASLGDATVSRQLHSARFARVFLPSAWSKQSKNIVLGPQKLGEPKLSEMPCRSDLTISRHLTPTRGQSNRKYHTILASNVQNDSLSIGNTTYITIPICSLSLEAHHPTGSSSRKDMERSCSAQHSCTW